MQRQRRRALAWQLRGGHLQLYQDVPEVGALFRRIMLGLCNFAAVVSGRLASGSWTHDVELVTEAEVGRERTAAVLGCSYGLSGPYGRAGHRPRSSRRPPSPSGASDPPGKREYRKWTHSEVDR